MRSANSEQGHKFEGDVKAAFRAASLIHPIRFSKVTDTGAAGGRVVASVDGDFELTAASGIPGQPYRFNIEAKSSRVDDEFRSCFRSLVKSDQLGRLRLAIRAGSYGVFFFKAVGLDQIEVWSAQRIIDKYYVRAAKLDGAPAYTVACGNLKTFAMQISKDPKEFLAQLQRSTL